MNYDSKRSQEQPQEALESSESGRNITVQNKTQQEDKTPGASQSSRLVELVHSLGATLFRTSDKDVYAVLSVNGHHEVQNLSSSPFRDFITRIAYRETKKTPTEQAIAEAVRVLRGEALYDPDSPAHEVHVRVAKNGDKVYVDLANDDWQVVEIDANGWRILDQSPVMFVRSNTTMPLPQPERHGDLSAIRNLVNCGTDDDFLLICGWIVGAFNPTGPFPILCLHGQQGSGKSSTCKFLKKLIDNSKTPLRGFPRNELDLWISAKHCHVLSYDNASEIKDWLSDSLCQISTGGGYAVRAHYQNDEEHVFNATKPILVNGIPDAAVRSDLVDRSMILHLPRIEARQRLTEIQLSERSERSFPMIMGAVFDAVSKAIRNLNDTHLSDRCRMADFEKWVTAAGLGGDFSAAYRRNRNEVNSTIVESSPLASAIVTLLTKIDRFEGTASKLQTTLAEYFSGQSHPSWLKNSQTLSGELRRISPNLARVGIEVDRECGRDTFNCRLLTIARTSQIDR